MFFFLVKRYKAFFSGEGSLRFKSSSGQIGQSVANGSPLLQHFGAVLPLEEMLTSAMTWKRARKIVARFGVLQRV